MSTKAVATTYTTGQTLYWYPVSRSLADWATYRVAATESIAPNLGRYTATLDTDLCDTSVDADCVFALFVGASQPSSFDTAIQLASALSELAPGLVDKINLIGTGSATLSAPVGVAGNIKRIYRGASYKTANDRAFVWTFADPGNIATPGSNTCTFAGVKRDDATQTWSVTGTLATGSGGNLTATFEFTPATTSGLTLGDYEWKVTCVDDSSNVIVIASTDRQRLTRLIDN